MQLPSVQEVATALRSVKRAALRMPRGKHEDRYIEVRLQVCEGGDVSHLFGIDRHGFDLRGRTAVPSQAGV